MTAVVLDTETTGLVAATSRIIEIAVVGWISGEVLLKTYVDPECHIAQEITKINGINNETVIGAPKWRDVAHEVGKLIESAEVVIGQNPSFDKGMIDAEMLRIGTEIKWPLLVCTKRLWDVYEPREARNLTNAYRRFVDRAGFEGAHGALADTNACRDVLKAQIKEFGLDGVKWDEMDPERTLWFGPSAHILRMPSESGETKLVINFGKWKDTPVLDVDIGFYRWIRERDFPDHVIMLAIKMIEFGRDEAKLNSWAREYQP